MKQQERRGREGETGDGDSSVQWTRHGRALWESNDGDMGGARQPAACDAGRKRRTDATATIGLGTLV